MSLRQPKNSMLTITMGALVALSLTLSACSKSKEPQVREAAPENEILDPTESTADFIDLANTDTDSSSGGEGDVIVVNLGNNSEELVEEVHAHQELTAPQEEAATNQAIIVEEVVEEGPAPREYQNPEDLQSTMKDIRLPENVFSTPNFDLYGEYGTGAKMNDALFFTDASVDGLIAYLRDTLRTEKDRAFSGRIHGVQMLEIDRERGDHTIRFSLRGGLSDMVFYGRADRRGVITYTSAGDDSGLRLDGICLDTYDHCHNLLIRVQQNAEEGLVTGFIVFRATPGSVVLEGYAPEISGSPMDRWMNFIENTKRHRQLRDAGAATSTIVNRMQYFTFRSITVLFGESRFEADMEVLRPNLCSELILVNGPLVKSFDSNRFALPLTQPRTEFISRNGMTQDDLGLFMGEIQTATLVNNSGRGDIRVQLNVANNVAQDTLQLTFERKHVETNLDRVCYLHPVNGLCTIAIRELDPMER